LLAIAASGQVRWTTPGAAALLQIFAYGLPVALAAALVRLAEQDDRGMLRHELGDSRLEFMLVARSGDDEWLFRIAEIRAGAEERLLARRHALTDREAEVLLWISRGKANREISEILGISPRTVNKHLEQVFAKMGVENRASAAAIAVRSLAQ
jgi:DNA-binding CsgD family transcriptional regulator